MPFLSFFFLFLTLWLGPSPALAALALQQGHEVIITKNVEETTYWKFELIKNAQKSLEISAGFAGGEVFKQTVKLMDEALERNPELIIHFYCSDISAIFTKEDGQRLQQLKKKFTQRFHYITAGLTPSIQGQALYITENHMKLIIADEKYFLLGGTNLTDFLSTSTAANTKLSIPNFLPSAASDIDVVGKGPAARELRLGFFHVYEMLASGTSLNDYKGPFPATLQGYTAVAEEEKSYIEAFENHADRAANIALQSAFSGPRFARSIGALYHTLIAQAQREIAIAHMYFFPVDAIYDQLVAATDRRVSLTLITQGISTKDIVPSNLTYVFMNRNHYLPIAVGKKAGYLDFFKLPTSQPSQTTIYEFSKKKMIYHKKAMVVDKRYTLIGSYNLGKKSEYADFEVALVIDSEVVAQQVLSILEKDKGEATKIPYKEMINWYFNPLYDLTDFLEGLFFDGLTV